MSAQKQVVYRIVHIKASHQILETDPTFCPESTPRGTSSIIHPSWILNTAETHLSSSTQSLNSTVSIIALTLGDRSTPLLPDLELGPELER